MILTAIQLTSLKKILTTVSEWLIYQSFAQQYAQINFFYWRREIFLVIEVMMVLVYSNFLNSYFEYLTLVAFYSY